MLVCCVRLLSDTSKKFEAKVRFLCSPQSKFFKRKDKPIGGGHCLENSSELTTRVGSTPTLSAKGACTQMARDRIANPSYVSSNLTVHSNLAMWRSGSAQLSYTEKVGSSNLSIATKRLCS